MNPKIKSSLTIFIWTLIVWSIGIWLGWWALGWNSFGFAMAAFFILFLAILKSGPQDKSDNLKTPSIETVEEEIHNLRQGQLRILRQLVYKASEKWENQRADDSMWIGIKFFPLDLIVRVSVRMIMDNEDTSLEGLQAYAKMHYESQQGAQLVRNEIIPFADRKCVLSESIHKPVGGVRRYSFTVLGSEYCVQFTGTGNNFTIYEPFISEFLNLCQIRLPVLQDHTIFGGRVKIGIPSGWSHIEEESDLSVWQGTPGPLDLRFHLVEGDLNETDSLQIFCRAPGFSKKSGNKTLRYRMDENGLTVHHYGDPSDERWAWNAVKLPNGGFVVVETNHHGSREDKFQDFLIEPLRRSLVASITDTSVPIL